MVHHDAMKTRIDNDVMLM